MLAIVSKQTTPPGGYRYRVEQTGQTFHAWTAFAIRQQVVNHLTANSIPVPHNLDALIEDFTCQGQPAGICDETDPIKSFLSNLHLTWQVIKAGTSTIGAWALDGFTKVEPAVADARAGVCASCPNNKFPQGCSPCQSDALHRLVHKLVGADNTRYDDRLHACVSCGCALRVKVWAPLRFVLKHPPMSPYPPQCWITKESANA